MSTCNSRYSHLEKPARTYDELLQVNVMLYWKSTRPFDSDVDGDYLKKCENKFNREFPESDATKHVPSVLKNTLQHYDPAKGRKFRELFEHNLRRCLRRERSEGTYRRRRRKLFESTSDDRAAQTEASYDRWSLCMLNVVLPQLDDELKQYINMRRQNMAVGEIASRLGVPERSLRNRYGGGKLSRLVRQAIAKFVNRMPVEHVRLLTRHLLDEADLSWRDVETLIGMRFPVDKSVPLMEEGQLLAVLGWPPIFFEENRPSLANLANRGHYVL